MRVGRVAIGPPLRARPAQRRGLAGACSWHAADLPHPGAGSPACGPLRRRQQGAGFPALSRCPPPPPPTCRRWPRAPPPPPKTCPSSSRCGDSASATPADEAALAAQLRELLPGTAVVELAGRPIWRGARAAPAPAAGLIQRVQLMPAWRGAGIGGRLIAGLLDEARACGVRVGLSVLKTSPAALALYERLGFVVTDECEARLQPAGAAR
ncbi:MAG: GNAT family N-acetyltransferase [Comamonadaceae bacterium]|nr:GNAT family N-acetyltransferase [Comamonadaceae bacterium]